MSDERTHHITLKLAHDYEFTARFDDVPNAPTITFDEPAPLGDGKGPNAAAVLGAAVGNCLSASLAFCLRRARADLVDMTAEVTTHVAKNEKGRYRISAIDVVLEPLLAADSAGPLDRCEALFEDFCIVTASVKQGIPVHVSLKGEQEKTAA